MKRLLFGIFVVLALVAGPVAGASADISFKGTCHVTGVATFAKPLTGSPQTDDYDFLSGPPGKNNVSMANDPDSTNCSNVTINGNAVPDANGPARVHVSAVNQMLSCGASQGQGGQGLITLANGVEIPFTLDIDGAVSEVALTVRGQKSGSAPGHASFSQYADPAATAQACGGSGVSKLGFTADFDNTNGDALVDPGTNPPTTSSSGTTPSGGGTTQTTQPSGGGRTPSSCVVPKLKGKTLTQARKALRAAKCSLGKVTKKSGKVKKGRVIASKPKAGTKLVRGAKVALVVSKGK